LIFGSYLAHRSGANHSSTDRKAIYATYNCAREGDLRDNYYAHRKVVWPPMQLRKEGEQYKEGALRYGYGSPMLSVDAGKQLEVCCLHSSAVTTIFMILFLPLTAWGTMLMSSSFSKMPPIRQPRSHNHHHKRSRLDRRHPKSLIFSKHTAKATTSASRSLKSSIHCNVPTWLHRTRRIQKRLLLLFSTISDRLF